MKFKSLFLGSAAALLATGAAHAADLSAAEPVNYVKVCDAFGPGYYYAPGTDTCIRISGYVRFDINLNKSGGSNYPDSHHYFQTKAQLNVYAKSMTEYGPLTGWIQTEAKDPLSDTGLFLMTAAVLSLGPLSAGYDYSIFSPSAYTFSTDTNQLKGQNGQARTNFIGLNWAMNGFGVAIAAEDYRGRDGGLSTGTIPDIVGNITGASGPLKFILAAGYGDRTFGSSFGVNGAVHINLDMLAKGDDLLLGAIYASGDDGWIDGKGNALGSSTYALYGSFLHLWTSKVSSTITATYRGDTSATTLVGNIKVTPVKNFSVQGEVTATGTNFASNVFTGLVRLQRNFP